VAGGTASFTILPSGTFRLSGEDGGGGGGPPPLSLVLVHGSSILIPPLLVLLTNELLVVDIIPDLDAKNDENRLPLADVAFVGEYDDAPKVPRCCRRCWTISFASSTVGGGAAVVGADKHCEMI
jgi:hypothetical protein